MRHMASPATCMALVEGSDLAGNIPATAWFTGHPNSGGPFIAAIEGAPRLRWSATLLFGEWGVRAIFGYPRDGIDGVLGALNRADGAFDFIQVRHEEIVAFMASAYAKFAGERSVCLTISGPGASHPVTGLYDALLDRDGEAGTQHSPATQGVGLDLRPRQSALACFPGGLVGPLPSVHLTSPRL